METKTARSEHTLAAILDTSLAMAAAHGLDSLTIGDVAKRLGLSKSGVFSRIGSREALQRAVIEEYSRRFQHDIFSPALDEPRGLPRLEAIMRLWMQRARDVEIESGCLYCAGAFEFGDREGPLRELLLTHVLRWRAALRRTVMQAVECNHLRPDLDADQVVSELDGMFVALMREARFLRDPKAPERAWQAFERLIDSLRFVEPVTEPMPLHAIPAASQGFRPIGS